MVKESGLIVIKGKKTMSKTMSKTIKVYEAFVGDVLRYATTNQDECNNYCQHVFEHEKIICTIQITQRMPIDHTKK